MHTFNCWGPYSYKLLIMFGHVMGWAPVWAIGGPGDESLFSSIPLAFVHPLDS